MDAYYGNEEDKGKSSKCGRETMSGKLLTPHKFLRGGTHLCEIESFLPM